MFLLWAPVRMLTCMHAGFQRWPPGGRRQVAAGAPSLSPQAGIQFLVQFASGSYPGEQVPQLQPMAPKRSSTLRTNARTASVADLPEEVLIVVFGHLDLKER